LPTTLIIPDADHYTPETQVDVITTIKSETPKKRQATLAMHCQTSALDKQTDIVIIIPLARIAFIDTRLPNVSALKRDQLVKFAIEDKLTIDPSTVHAVVLGPSLTSEQHFIIAAMSSEWLSSVLAWLRAVGITPRFAYPASAMYAVKASEWIVVLEKTDGVAIRQDGLAYALEASDFSHPPFQLTLALNEAVAAASGKASPRAIRLTKTPDVQFDESSWQTELGNDIALIVDEVIETPRQMNVAQNLLTGKYLPVHQGVSAINALKRPLIIGFSILILHIAFVSFDAWRLARERTAIEQSMRDVFMTAFPDAVAIVNPPLQLSRQLVALKTERGMAEDAARELLALAATITRDIASSIVNVNVKADQQQVTLQLAKLNAEAEKNLQSQLALIKKPYQTTINTEAGVTTLVIRRGNQS
jgi:type II secretion system protein L